MHLKLKTPADPLGTGSVVQAEPAYKEQGVTFFQIIEAFRFELSQEFSFFFFPFLFFFWFLQEAHDLERWPDLHSSASSENPARVTVSSHIPLMNDRLPYLGTSAFSISVYQPTSWSMHEAIY